MALDPRIEAIRQEYGLEASDFWQIPQNKQWVCRHSALELVAVKANIEWSPPQVIEANTAAGIAVISVSGLMGTRAEWSTGEASPKNNKNAYPWAMAEKRAKDRVILKLVGLHGLVYSEAESDADGFRAPPSAAQEVRTAADEAPQQTLSKAKARPLDGDLRKEIDACMTVEELGRLWQSRQFQDALKSLPADWQEAMREHKDQAKQELENHPPQVPKGYVPPARPPK